MNYLQTVETLIRRRVLRRLIWVCTVCQITLLGVSRLQWVNILGISSVIFAVIISLKPVRKIVFIHEMQRELSGRFGSYFNFFFQICGTITSVNLFKDMFMDLHSYMNLFRPLVDAVYATLVLLYLLA